LLAQEIAFADHAQETDQEARPRKSKFTAKTADKHDLYQRSVQDPETEVFFINRFFKKISQARAAHAA